MEKTIKHLTIDFESKDPFMGKSNKKDLRSGLGTGWPYPGDHFKILGCAVKIDEQDSFYLDLRNNQESINHLKELIESSDTIIAHNASYELGCLYRLGISYKYINIYDTEVMSRLYDSSLKSHALDELGKKYLKNKKNNDGLVELVMQHDLVPMTKRFKELYDSDPFTFDNDTEKEFKKRSASYNADCLKYAKSNMDVLQDLDINVVAKYANIDTDLTYRLFKFFRDSCSIKQWNKDEFMKLSKKYSHLANIITHYRAKGVRVDLKRCRQVLQELRPKIAEKFAKLYDLAGEDFNHKSPDDCVRVFRKILGKTGYRDVDSNNNKYTDAAYKKMAEKIANWEDKEAEQVYREIKEKGMPSVNSPWLEKQSDALSKTLLEARKYKNICDNFVEKILKLQTLTLNKTEDEVAKLDYGIVYPELNLLRARTGRFSCSGPNIQQIPSRDKYLGPLCRSIFVPFEGEKWYSLDFSNQEGRIFISDAFRLGCEGVEEFILEFKKDPAFDIHKKVAEMVGTERKAAKEYTFGLLYGMGLYKTSIRLGTTLEGANILRDKYNQFIPFLDQLNTICKNSLKSKGYIKTIGGRRLSIDPPVWVDGELRTFEFKALNKRIQGSAADQTIESMIIAYDEDIPILFPVHDENNISGYRWQAERLKVIMETCVDLAVPSLTEIGEGNNWSEAH